MAIVHVRIDDRLIHGQVATMWLTSISANRAMVVQDDADDVLKASLRLACPSGIALSVLAEEKAAQRICEGRYEGQRVFIVAKSPGVIFRMVERGVPIQELNVGNITYQQGNVKISNQVALNQEDAEIFHKLHDAGVSITLQLQPDKAAEDFIALMKKRGL